MNNTKYETPKRFHPVSGVPIFSNGKRVAFESDEYAVISRKLRVDNLARIKEQNKESAE